MKRHIESESSLSDLAASNTPHPEEALDARCRWCGNDTAFVGTSYRGVYDNGPCPSCEAGDRPISKSVLQHIVAFENERQADAFMAEIEAATTHGEQVVAHAVPARDGRFVVWLERELDGPRARECPHSFTFHQAFRLLRQDGSLDIEYESHDGGYGGSILEPYDNVVCDVCGHNVHVAPDALAQTVEEVSAFNLP